MQLNTSEDGRLAPDWLMRTALGLTHLLGHCKYTHLNKRSIIIKTFLLNFNPTEKHKRKKRTVTECVCALCTTWTDATHLTRWHLRATALHTAADYSQDFNYFFSKKNCRRLSVIFRTLVFASSVFSSVLIGFSRREIA